MSESFGSGLVAAAQEASQIASAPVEHWYVRNRGRTTIAECRRRENAIIYFLPGESIAKTYWLEGRVPDGVSNPEIEFIQRIPSVRDVQKYFAPDEDE